MDRTVPRIGRLSEREVEARDGLRFALLHVVSGERHHIGWFQLSDDEWRVGLVSAGDVVDAGGSPARVRLDTAKVVTALAAAHDADDHTAPEPVGPITNPLRFHTDRRRAIERLRAEVERLG